MTYAKKETARIPNEDTILIKKRLWPFLKYWQINDHIFVLI